LRLHPRQVLFCPSLSTASRAPSAVTTHVSPATKAPRTCTVPISRDDGVQCVLFASSHRASCCPLLGDVIPKLISVSEKVQTAISVCRSPRLRLWNASKCRERVRSPCSTAYRALLLVLASSCPQNSYQSLVTRRMPRRERRRRVVDARNPATQGTYTHARNLKGSWRKDRAPAMPSCLLPPASSCPALTETRPRTSPPAHLRSPRPATDEVS